MGEGTTPSVGKTPHFIGNILPDIRCVFCDNNMYRITVILIVFLRQWLRNFKRVEQVHRRNVRACYKQRGGEERCLYAAAGKESSTMDWFARCRKKKTRDKNTNHGWVLRVRVFQGGLHPFLGSPSEKFHLGKHSARTLTHEINILQKRTSITAHQIIASKFDATTENADVHGMFI